VRGRFRGKLNFHDTDWTLNLTVKPVFSTLFASLLVACATAENDPLGIHDPSTLGGSAGSGGESSGGGTGGSVSGGSSSTGGGGSGGEGGSSLTGGQPGGGTGGAAAGGTGGSGGGGSGGTGFIVGGGGNGGSGGTGGSAAGGGGTGGKATGGTGGTAGTGGAGGTAGTGGKATGGTGGTAGTGGTGGAPNGTCAGSPLGPKTEWTATAPPGREALTCDDPTDPYCGPAVRAVDGITDNRFTTGKARLATDWLQIDFGKEVAVKQVILRTASGNNDYTRDYEIRMSNDAATIADTPIIVMGTGVITTTTIDFPTVKTGRYLRINQTTAAANWWSVAEVDVSCQ
jgi:hypothetical protein